MLAVAAVATPPPPVECGMGSMDTVIVGAGAAGIARGAAAGTLLASGCWCWKRAIALAAGRRRITPSECHWTSVQPGCISPSRMPGHASPEDTGLTVLRREPGWGPAARIGAHTPTPAERVTTAANYQRYNELIETAAAQGKDVALSDILPCR